MKVQHNFDSTFSAKIVSRVLLVLCMLLMWSKAFEVAFAQSVVNPIIAENRNIGSNDWILNAPGYQIADERQGQIVGYANLTSVELGAAIELKVSVNPAQDFTIRIFRMGWYDGKGARLMREIGPLRGKRQKDCPTDVPTGLTECAWTTDYVLNIPQNWTSGIYLTVLTNAEKFRSHIAFVVKDNNRVADFIYQQPVLTYSAYNNFPDNLVNGKSLYDFNSFGKNTITNSPRAVKVSLNRPDSISDFSGASFNSSNGYWEIYIVQWLERTGYNVVYSTDIDTHQDGKHLLQYRGVIVPSHSEYWTDEMVTALVYARDAGVNLAFLGANAVYWRVRLETSAAGEVDRTLVSYKSAALDPVPDETQKTILFRDLNRPEQTLIGVQWAGYQDSGKNTSFVPLKIEHWALERTKLTPDRPVPGLIGNEVDRLFKDYPAPISKTYALLASSPFTTSDGVLIRVDTTIYQAPSGAWVFATGTMSWGWGLGRPVYEDASIKQLTQNILDRFAGIVRTIPATSAAALPDDRPANSTASKNLSEAGVATAPKAGELLIARQLATTDYLAIGMAVIALVYTLWRIRRRAIYLHKLKSTRQRLNSKR